ncbi:MAG: DNA repair protein RadA, partial [Gammaproteobacteria bacterium]|nr:DNA repair protein RadA [Gemmatimonadota bacterium]NIU78147.1 DNA repair protein RadA [Gammaproteobacteria bacterium]NIX21776.1 DNA repair protein RadA [Actinomycetota bacterium]
VSGRLAGAGHTVLYVSGEESAYQVKLRAERLEEPTEDLLMVAETSTEEILAIVEAAAPDILVVDSIQTL